jgi:phospholipase A1
LEIEEMWRQQLDTSKIALSKSMYLQIDKQEILQMFNRLPSFAMYKDNYFITGIPVNEKITKNNADVKFQISVRQRLTKTVLPFNSFLFLTYTQKSFWSIYKKSSPFDDNNYNPGFAWITPVIRNNKLQGTVAVSLEHESNGKDSLESRGWNFITLSGVYFFNASFSIQAKLWAGILDKGEPELEGGGNPDLFKYRGYGLIALNYRSLNNKFRASAMLNPRGEFGKFNIQLEFNYRPRAIANQYLFVQWYNGYGESLLDYNKFTSILRVGICIKPPLSNLY